MGGISQKRGFNEVLKGDKQLFEGILTPTQPFKNDVTGGGVRGSDRLWCLNGDKGGRGYWQVLMSP